MGSKSAKDKEKDEKQDEFHKCKTLNRHFCFDEIQYSNMGFFYRCPSEVFLLISNHLEIPDIVRLTFANKGIFSLLKFNC